MIETILEFIGFIAVACWVVWITACGLQSMDNEKAIKELQDANFKKTTEEIYNKYNKK